MEEALKESTGTLEFKGGQAMSFRSFLYRLAKFLGDWSAVSSGSSKKMAKRVGRRTAGKATGKTLRKLFK